VTIAMTSRGQKRGFMTVGTVLLWAGFVLGILGLLNSIVEAAERGENEERGRGSEEMTVNRSEGVGG